MKRAVAGIALMVSAMACAPMIPPHEAKVRKYEDAEYASRDQGRTVGSLYSDTAPGLFEEGQAMHIGDIVTIQIDESSNATRNTATNSLRDDNTTLNVSSFFKAMSDLGLNPDLIKAGTQQDFRSNGNTARAGTLTAMLPARVKKQLPNGDLYIEGTKLITLNDEQSELYMSGVVRPVDIRRGNVVNSSVIADVELEFTGRGVLSERSKPGWFSRVLSKFWPF